jgi:hypothetical protein
VASASDINLTSVGYVGTYFKDAPNQLTKRMGLGTVEANNYNWDYYQDESSPGQAYLNLGTDNALIWQNGGPGGLWDVVGVQR